MKSGAQPKPSCLIPDGTKGEGLEKHGKHGKPEKHGEIDSRALTLPQDAHLASLAFLAAAALLALRLSRLRRFASSPSTFFLP